MTQPNDWEPDVVVPDGEFWEPSQPGTYRVDRQGRRYIETYDVRQVVAVICVARTEVPMSHNRCETGHLYEAEECRSCGCAYCAEGVDLV